MTDARDLLATLWSQPVGLSPGAKAVASAVLLTGSDAGPMVVAPFAAIEGPAETTDRTLRRMRARGEGAPVLVWQVASVGVDVAALERTLRPDAPSEDGRSVRTLRPKTDAPSAGTVLDSRAGVTGLPSDTTYLQAFPPTPQGVSSGPAAGPAEPDIEAGAETVAAVLDVLDTDAHAGKPQAFERLLATLRHRGAIVRQRQHGELVALLASQPTAVIASVAAAIERSAGPVRSPVGFVRAVLDDAVASVQAERAALESQRREDERMAAELAERRRVEAEMSDPARVERGALLFGAIRAELEGGNKGGVQ